MTGRYKVYPEYKESGVEWLGKIPKHWSVSPVKWQIEAVDGGAWGEDPTGYRDTIVLRSTEQTAEGKWEILNPALRKLSMHEAAATCLVKDDLLMTKSSGSSTHIGKTSIVTDEVANLQCGFSNFMQRIRVNKNRSAKLYWYIFNNEFTREQLNFLSNSTTGLANLNATMIKEVISAVASKTEQQAIVNFLDHETDKIDTLITKQEKLIELLKEKRQAVISHAVTKGLNPDAPLKDSGAKWLGEVPEHWDVYRSKRLFPESKNRAPISDMQLSATQDYGVISQKKFMQLAGRKVVQLNSNQELRKKVHVGDFVISMRSFQGGLERAWEEGGIRSSYVVLKPSKLINKDYFQYLFKSVRYIQAIQSTANFIRDGQDMNYQNFILIDLPLPSLKEQKYIASYLHDHINQIDSLIEKAQKAISLMQERKTALISAAVTGKIDVRDWIALGEANNG